MAITYINYLTGNQTGESLNDTAKDQALQRNGLQAIENESSAMVKDGETKHLPPYKKSTKSRKPFKLDDNEMPYPRSASFSSAIHSFEGHTKTRKRSWIVPLKNCGFVSKSTTKVPELDSSPKDPRPRTGELMTDSHASVPQSVSSTSSGCQSNMDTGSDNSSGNVMLKHTISKRFIEESRFTRDSSPHSRKSKKRRKLMRRKDREFRSGRSHFTTTHSTQKSNFSRNSDSIEESNSAGHEMCRYLPGFVLHPTGSYYIPMTIRSSDIRCEIFKNATQQQQQCGYHPVTLLVQFKGPFIHMDNEKRSSNGHTTVTQSLSSDGRKCSSCGCNTRKLDIAESK